MDEWDDSVMGQWPFGNPLPEEQRILREMIDCLDLLDSLLVFEEWVMYQVEAAQDAQDDDINVESEDEDYSSDEERDSEDENWFLV